MIAPTQRAAALLILLVWLGFIAGWTVGSIPLTLAGAPFGTLWVALLSGLCGTGLALRSEPILARLLMSLPESAKRDAPSRKQIFTAALVTVLVFVTSGWFLVTGDARPLWGISLLTCLFVLSMTRSDGITLPQPQVPQEGPALSGVALLALVLWLIYIVILRHDADDAFYLNLPIGLADAPHGMLAWDTMYGAGSWPVLGSNYRVEALQTLIAAIAWGSGLPVVYVSHLVLPTIWCLIWAATLAVIGAGLFGRNWWIFALLAVLSTFAFAGTLQSWGVHGVSRLFHGKAPLILIIVPLIYFATRRMDVAKIPLRTSVPLQAGLICAALGLTANAIYIAPLALGLATFSGWVERGFVAPERLWSLMAAGPAMAAGLWLLFFDTPVTVPEDESRSFVALGLWNMFPGKVLLGLMALTICAGILASILAPQARFITGCILGALLFVLNPFLWPAYDDFVTGGLNFRLWWALPLPFLFAIMASWAVLRTRFRIWLLAASVLVLFTLSMTRTGLLGMQETEIRLSFTKRPLGVLGSVDQVIDKSEGHKVLAVEEVSAWISTVENHPPLVYVRRIYLDQNITVVDDRELGPRRLLANWINGADDMNLEEISTALQHQCPGLLVFPKRRKPYAFDTLAVRYGAELVASVQDQQIYRINLKCT